MWWWGLWPERARKTRAAKVAIKRCTSSPPHRPLDEHSASAPNLFERHSSERFRSNLRASTDRSRPISAGLGQTPPNLGQALPIQFVPPKPALAELGRRVCGDCSGVVGWASIKHVQNNVGHSMQEAKTAQFQTSHPNLRRASWQHLPHDCLEFRILQVFGCARFRPISAPWHKIRFPGLLWPGFNTKRLDGSTDLANTSCCVPPPIACNTPCWTTTAIDQHTLANDEPRPDTTWKGPNSARATLAHRVGSRRKRSTVCLWCFFFVASPAFHRNCEMRYAVYSARAQIVPHICRAGCLRAEASQLLGWQT